MLTLDGWRSVGNIYFTWRRWCCFKKKEKIDSGSLWSATIATDKFNKIHEQPGKWIPRRPLQKKGPIIDTHTNIRRKNRRIYMVVDSVQRLIRLYSTWRRVVLLHGRESRPSSSSFLRGSSTCTYRWMDEKRDVSLCSARICREMFVLFLWSVVYFSIGVAVVHCHLIEKERLGWTWYRKEAKI